jgi:DNA-binding PadR family transcriptional regulator
MTTERTPESYLPLHPLELQVLLLLTDGPKHAYRIVGGVEARQPEWSQILPTNLYRRIWRLAAAGLIEETEPAGPEEARKRRYFAITPLGRAVAAAEAGRLRTLLTEAAASGVVPAARAGGPR